MAEVHVFAQSRLGYWDWMVNDARVRLLLDVQKLPTTVQVPRVAGGCGARE